MFEQKDINIVAIISVIFFLVCFVVARILLPENCNLFEDNVPHPQTCHTIPMPDDCGFCENRSRALVSSAIAGLGILSLILPFIVWAVRSYQMSSTDEIRIVE